LGDDFDWIAIRIGQPCRPQAATKEVMWGAQRWDTAGNEIGVGAINIVGPETDLRSRVAAAGRQPVCILC
jgi:hypothetical protein